jgi:hypothetical protein
MISRTLYLVVLVSLPLHKFVSPSCWYYWLQEIKKYWFGVACHAIMSITNFIKIHPVVLELKQEDRWVDITSTICVNFVHTIRGNPIYTSHLYTLSLPLIEIHLWTCTCLKSKHRLIMWIFHKYLKVVSPRPNTYSKNTWYGMNVSPRLITWVASPKIVPPCEQNHHYVKRDNISLCYFWNASDVLYMCFCICMTCSTSYSHFD